MYIVAVGPHCVCFIDRVTAVCRVCKYIVAVGPHCVCFIDRVTAVCHVCGVVVLWCSAEDVGLMIERLQVHFWQFHFKP